MKAARIHEYGKPVVLEDVPIPDIGPDEILIQVKACGMCRSDAQLIDGYFRPFVDIPTPITIGHEISGVVSTIGRNVPKIAGFHEGDPVGVAPGWGDGVCRHCLVGNTHICPNVRWPGFGPYGGFAEYLPVPARYLIKADRGLRFEQIAPLTDVGLTPYRGIKKLRDAGALGPGRIVGVFGVGGLGSYAVQYAKLLGGGAKVSPSHAMQTSSPSPRRTAPTTSSPSGTRPPKRSRRNLRRLPAKGISTPSSIAPGPPK